MKYLASLALALAVAQATPVKRSDPLGIDVSDYQTSIDWTTVVDNGIKFVSRPPRGHVQLFNLSLLPVC